MPSEAMTDAAYEMQRERYEARKTNHTTQDKENTMQTKTTTRRARNANPITIAPAHIVAGLATEGVTIRPQIIRRFLRTNADRFPKRDGAYRFTRTEAEAIIAELIK